MNSTVKIVGGFLLGAAIGTGIGILVAPDSGKQTRKLLAKKSKDLAKQASDVVTDYISNVKGEYKDKVDTYAKYGKATLDKTKENVNA